MFNELLLLQTLSFIILLFFIQTLNIITLWYLAGLYLILLGFWLWLDDADIFIGFLWVIDLGVGLVFFLFILHFSTFLHQKSTMDKSSRILSLVNMLIFFLLVFGFYFMNPTDNTFTTGFDSTWFFYLSWYDYYDFLYAQTVTDLNLLREIYFYQNSFDFFIINFMLFFGIISSILLCFLIKRIFNFLNLAQLINYRLLSLVNATYFIRNQNFLKQQATSTGTRVWLKKKNDKL